MSKLDSINSEFGSVGVVHLVRRSNGLVPFKKFISSYERHKDLYGHDLVIIFKDFAGGDDLDYLEVLSGIGFVRFDYAGDGGYDLGPYIAVSQKYNYDHFLFLNSFTEIECDNWLTVMIHALVKAPDAGIVGATGSWESAGDGYPPFPNPSIRTNGFLITSALMRGIEFGTVLTKEDALHIESGFDSLTRQVIDQGKNAFVVDRSGAYFGIDDWLSSGTFRSYAQRGLIFSDNRTRAYADGDTWTREYLYDLAWIGRAGKANPFKRHKLRHRIRRLLARNTATRHL